MAIFDNESNLGRVAWYLKEAREMRQIAALLSLRTDRAKVIQSAMEYEQRAAALQS